MGFTKVIKESFAGWHKLDYLLMATCIIIVGVIPIFKSEEGWVFTLITSVAAIVSAMLNYKGQGLTFPVYVIYSVVYIYVSLTNHMYGEAILYGVWALPMYTMSTVKWIKKTNVVPEGFEINILKKKHLIIILVLGVLVTLGYGYGLSMINSNVPYLNSLGTVCSATGIYMTNRRYREQWYAWLAYTFVFAAIWMSNMTISFLVQSCLFLVLNVLGLLNWNKEYKRQLEQ